LGTMKWHFKNDGDNEVSFDGQVTSFATESEKTQKAT